MFSVAAAVSRFLHPNWPQRNELSQQQSTNPAIVPLSLDHAGSSATSEWVSSIDTWVFDCDGVLWSGDAAVPGAVQAISSLHRAGKRVFLVTNNSTKSKTQFAAKVAKLGFTDITGDSLMSSAISTSLYLRQAGFQGKKVFVIGEPGLRETLREAGVIVEDEDTQLTWSTLQSEEGRALDQDVSAVVVGWSSSVNFAQLVMATLYIRQAKVPLIATNRDAASPLLPDGTLVPGNGTTINYLETATGTQAINCGKPSPTLAKIMLQDHGIDPSRACMVGDRLDTDIEFGRSTGMQQMLVLSGVTSQESADQMLAGTFDGPVIPTVIASSIAVLKD